MKIFIVISFCLASIYLSAQNVIINSQNKKMNVALSGNDSAKVFVLNSIPEPEVKDVFIILNMDQQDTDKWIHTFTFTTETDSLLMTLSQAASQGIYLVLLNNLFEKLEKGKTYRLNCETIPRDSKGEKIKPMKTPVCKIEIQ